MPSRFPRSLACAALLLLAVPAAAGADGGVTAPSYPGNTIQVAAPDGLVAGTAQQVRLSGHAEWGAPTTPTTGTYGVSLYAQDPRIDPSCAVSFGAQLNKSINLPGLNASVAPTGFVVGDNRITISPDPPATGTDWAIDSGPFAIRLGVDRVLLCAFQRLITDDVAAFQRTVRVVPPRCRFRASRVRRGQAATLRCNFTGAVSARLARRGERTRTARTTIGAGGTAKLRVGRIARGRWTVRFTAGDLAVGRGAVTVR